MPTDIHPEFRELGRLRLGELDDTGSRPRPTALEFWRLTSPHQDLLEAAASAYGGIVNPADRGGFELLTRTSELEVLVPRQDRRMLQWWEFWTAAGLRRRCDGDTLVAGSDASGLDDPCLCDPSARECKITTRLAVILPDLPDLGVWKLTTRSRYAAGEILGSLEVLESVFGDALAPALLTIEERSTTRAGQTHRFVVPALRTRSSLRDLRRAELELRAPLASELEISASQSAEDVVGNSIKPSATADPTRPALGAGDVLEPEYGDLRPSELEEASPVEPDPKIASRPATAPPPGEITLGHWRRLLELLGSWDLEHFVHPDSLEHIKEIFTEAEAVALVRGPDAFTKALEHYTGVTNPEILNTLRISTFANRSFIEIDSRARQHPVARQLGGTK